MQPQFSPQDSVATRAEDLITYFALTDSRNKRTPFGIKKKDRDRHTYVIGKTGMGKSTLLENMAVQDIQRGEGICFIDPHGSTAEKLMEYIPEERVKDVLYFAPFDLQYPVSFNVLENVDADKRHLVVAGLMSTFEKIWVDAWSARMAYILQNTLGALLEFPGATLLGVNRMYIDKEYRKNVIAHITDPSVRSFWVDEYTKFTDRYTQEATPAIQNKIGQFASNALVRNVIGQEQSSFNIRELMDTKKIFIVNLSKGRVGEGNANLLGSMLITKIYLAAMSRADTAASGHLKLPYFYLYVDEFQNFANKSFADILSEARKYKLALTIAHQYVEQMEEEVASAVFGNVGTMVTFRVGAYDAETLEKEFAPTFMAEDLVNLGARQIYLKLMIDGVSSQPFSAVTMPPIPEPEVNQKDRAIAYSRATFARPRTEVEKHISDWVGKKYEDPEAAEKERARLERRVERDLAPAPAVSTGIVASPARPYAERPSAAFAQAGPRPVRPATAHPREAPRGEWRDRAPQVSNRPPEPRRYENRPASTPAPAYQKNTPYEPSRPPIGTPNGAPVRPPQAAPAQPEIGSLREVLARLAAVPSDAAKPVATPSTPLPRIEVSRPDASTNGVTPVAPAQTNLSVRQLAPERSDGKSVSDSGRQELRDLLKRVTREPAPSANPAPGPERPAVTNTITDAPPTRPSVAPSTSQASEGTPPTIPPPVPHVVPPAVTSRPHAPLNPPLAPPEVGEEELRRLLHVEKPDL